MSWPQITLALKENRRELCLTGKDFKAHLQQHGLDGKLFDIKSLNYLTIHNTSLSSISGNFSKLTELQTLSLHSNNLSIVNRSIEKLDKLKILDLSHNTITSLNINLNSLVHLTVLNLSNNQLADFPEIDKCIKLQVIDLSHNKLNEFPDIMATGSLQLLSDVMLGNNLIESIPENIDVLTSLKLFDIANNKIAEVTFSLANCAKLKELNLKGNPIKDRRLLKLIDQCRTKQVLDYLKQHAPKDTATASKKKKGKQSADAPLANDLSSLKINDNSIKLSVKGADTSDTALKVVVRDAVKTVRPNIICCLLHGLKFNEDTFKRFIHLQTKLHETLCEKRNAATIATHDANTLTESTLIYTAMKPSELMIKPLNTPRVLSGKQLFDKLQMEADNLRKEKKRNIYSGIHKYLYLLEGKANYACLLKQKGADVVEEEVISFPPITNSDVSKISVKTESVLLEVTSHANVPLTKKIADTVIQDVVLLMGKEAGIVVEQLKVVDADGYLKSVYPSKMDLNFDIGVNITVCRV